MKKLNKKGFTLVELLAVVVILLAISVIAVSSISAAIERNKDKQNQAKIDIIGSYADLYYNEHKNTETNKCIPLETIKTYFNLTVEELTDAYGNPFGGVVKYTNTDGNFKWTIQSNC